MKHSRQQSIETLHIFISWVRENKTKDTIQHNTSSLDTTHQVTNILKLQMSIQLWVISSVGESICLTSRGSLVRIQYHPP